MSAITAAELLVRYTTKLGSAGDTTASSAGASLGTYVSTTAWNGGTLHDIFDAVSGGENAASQVDYRAVALINSNATNDLTNAVVYLSAEVSGGASIALAADSTAASARGGASAQALTATTDTSPGSPVTSLTYSSPTTAAGGVSLGTIPVGFVKIIWLRRTASNSAALSADGATVAFAGDTGSL